MDYEQKYEQKYREALGWMRSLYDGLHGATKEEAEHYFPELKENKSERVRKGLIKTISSLLDNTILYHTDITKEEALAWLEKQGEKKPTDKVEPKFHEGEWIIHQGTENIYQVVACIDNQYQLKYGDNYTVQKCADVDRCARLWDITKDAKDGDVLIKETGEPFIYNGNRGSYIPEFLGAYCGISDGRFRPNGSLYYWGRPIHPATKEQRDLLFSKMKEAGYKWDANKKELKKIESKKLDMTREEFRDKKSEDYRKRREDYGIKDPVFLDEIEEAYYQGMVDADKYPRWISVEEIQPKEDEWFLGYSPLKSPLSSMKIDVYNFNSNGLIEAHGITHWMPLPSIEHLKKVDNNE